MSGEVAYSGPRFADAALLTIDEVRRNEVQVPEGTYPYTVQEGDNLWSIAVASGYGDPPDMNAFYAQNEQYGDRNPNEIYPGEIVIVRVPENGTVPTGRVDENGDPLYQNYKDGAPFDAPYPVSALGESGLPVSSFVINEQGQRIRTDEHGNPANGRYQTDTNPDEGEMIHMADYRNGIEVPGTRSKAGMI